MHYSNILFSVSLLLTCFSSWAPESAIDKTEIIFGKEQAAILALKESKTADSSIICCPK